MVDPQLPRREREKLLAFATAHPDAWLRTDARTTVPAGSGFVAGQRLIQSAWVSVSGGIVTVAGHLVDRDADGWTPRTAYGRLIDEAVEAAYALLDLAVRLGELMLAGGAVVAASLVIHRVAERRRARALLVRARAATVHPVALTVAAARLLGRAQDAAAAVFASGLHQNDLDGLRAHNETHLPTEVWEIACGLHAYSQAQHAGGSGERVGAGADALGQVLAAIERRVEALETYAARAADADLRQAELAGAEQATARIDTVLDLLARTAGDAVAAQETHSLAERAGAVAAALRTLTDTPASDSARKAIGPAD
nr:hypothetical protein KPHV_87360 [Kitasatospora purpeofusca]